MHRSEFQYLADMPTNAEERRADIESALLTALDVVVSELISVAQRHVQATDYEDGRDEIRDMPNRLVKDGKPVTQESIDLGNDATDFLLDMIISVAQRLKDTPPATVEGVQDMADQLSKDPLLQLLDALSKN